MFSSNLCNLEKNQKQSNKQKKLKILIWYTWDIGCPIVPKLGTIRHPRLIIPTIKKNLKDPKTVFKKTKFEKYLMRQKKIPHTGNTQPSWEMTFTGANIND